MKILTLFISKMKNRPDRLVALKELLTLSKLVSNLHLSVLEDIDWNRVEPTPETRATARQVFQNLDQNMWIKATIDDRVTMTDRFKGPTNYSKITNYGLVSWHEGMNQFYLTSFCSLLVGNQYSIGLLLDGNLGYQLYNLQLRPNIFVTLINLHDFFLEISHQLIEVDCC